MLLVSLVIMKVFFIQILSIQSYNIDRWSLHRKRRRERFFLHLVNNVWYYDASLIMTCWRERVKEKSFSLFLFHLRCKINVSNLHHRDRSQKKEEIKQTTFRKSTFDFFLARKHISLHRMYAIIPVQYLYELQNSFCSYDSIERENKTRQTSDKF